ncbi:hypothetical protein AU184_04705 [Mycolicibacterium novocastrense]|nr:hypothetical protein AU072_00940 [Mycolicibacterium novocastrense]KUH74271.1 hypothetical protein AU183_12935 [Mycolicibacterium novocastrense]KUH75270.1 hypothetical protein AU184_04705 [Mycolicibacterium novocastrense]
MWRQIYQSSTLVHGQETTGNFGEDERYFCFRVWRYQRPEIKLSSLTWRKQAGQPDFNTAGPRFQGVLGVAAVLLTETRAEGCLFLGLPQKVGRDTEPPGDLVNSEGAAFEELGGLGVDAPRGNFESAIDNTDSDFSLRGAFGSSSLASRRHESYLSHAWDT